MACTAAVGAYAMHSIGAISCMSLNPLRQVLRPCLCCRKVEFDELLETVDILDIMVPLSDSTKGMINKETIGARSPAHIDCPCAPEPGCNFSVLLGWG